MSTGDRTGSPPSQKAESCPQNAEPLALIGDTDFILVENAAEAVRLLPLGQLAVLPGTTHMDLTRSTLLAPVIEAFLA